MLPPRPEFFKPIINEEFSKKLSIPPSFVDLLAGGLPKKCSLRGPRGNRLWNVEVEEMEDGLFFHKGWSRFVKEHSLEIGNFLVFEYYGDDSTFDVTIYVSLGCEKEFQEEEESWIPASTRKGKSVRSSAAAGHEETSSGRTVVFKSPHACFTGVVGKNRYRMNIPKKLATGLGLTGKKRVKFIDPVGKKWKVNLRFCKEPQNRLLMTEGMIACWNANNVSIGDTVVFEIVDLRRLKMKIHIFRSAGGRGRSVVLGGSKSRNYKV